MDNEAKILDYAHKQGAAANHAEKIAETPDGVYYGLSTVDADGFPLPTGLPLIVQEQQGKLTLIEGEKALTLLDSLSLEE